MSGGEGWARASPAACRVPGSWGVSCAWGTAQRALSRRESLLLCRVYVRGRKPAVQASVNDFL